MHEVGHTLGLRHNSAPPESIPDTQLSDPEFTRTHALTGSVMEYAPVNLASPGAALVAPVSDHARPYDYWRSSTPTNRSRRKTRRWSSVRLRPAAPIRIWPTRPMRTTSSASTRRAAVRSGNDPLAFARKRLDIAPRPVQAPGNADAAAGPGLRGAAPLAGLRDRRRGTFGRRAGASDRRPCARCATFPVRAATRCSRWRPACSATRSNNCRAACSRRTVSSCRRRCNGVSHPTSRAKRSLEAGHGSVATDFSLTQQVLGVQRALLNPDERRGRRAHHRQPGKATRRSDAFHLSSSMAGSTGTSGANCRTASTSPRLAANCSASI